MSVTTRQFDRRLARPKIGSVPLTIITAMFILASANWTFWEKSAAYLHGQPAALAFLVVGIACGYVALFLAFSVKFVIKPALIFFVVVSALGAWFMDHYGVIIDVEMLQSAVDTTNAEAGHFLNIPFVVHMITCALIPSAIIAWPRIVHRPYLQKLKWNLAVIVPALLVLGVAALINASTYMSLIREHRDWFGTLNPLAPIVNTVKLAIRETKDNNIIVKPLGQDAHVVGPAAGTRKPRVTIVIAGETARAESFSLGGYGPDTNPELARQDITYFSDTSSCGTITSVSLPCMFSQFTRKEYTHQKGLENENLVDVLTHAGINVEWWDNNTGDKGVAARMKSQQLFKSDDPKFCKGGECLDAIFLDRLDAWLDSVKTDSVLVMHQLGSHGPAYYLRYPDEFRRFTPDCRTAEFAKCSREEIINAYDNSILYTDHLLSTVIDRLKARETQISPSMIYMSDHGESTGEFGLYLHGAPYIVAPSQQTHVPYVLWLGKDEKAQIDGACLHSEAVKKQSHDNLFHTLLGMMHVETSVHDNNLDTLFPCRSGTS
ncbi:phosphatidylethanolamine:Kdo2-lipid A phosphoethanolamine transferase [Phyllobacterium sp. YR620]|uniref:phosphoethanolamine transferase n=1 Tax=Phyllobacterium sp. YR620 TaxID=1881066 RepID=UPI0008896708|nr:phosphoethanolamine--lipid A transferase [Phyllobacterium sp. YR620]SDO92711.1 phosphatidylethanolamine:Kdo2-lipid A phosphoethanolamine transferase [Phyllobacterium sp. YR620]